jgi:hypothetical protein
MHIGKFMRVSNTKAIALTLMILQLLVSVVVCQSIQNKTNRTKKPSKAPQSICRLEEECAKRCRGLYSNFFIQEVEEQPNTLFLVSRTPTSSSKLNVNYTWLVDNAANSEKIKSPILKIEKSKIRDGKFKVKLIAEVLLENKKICETETLFEADPNTFEIRVLDERVTKSEKLNLRVKQPPR